MRMSTILSLINIHLHLTMIFSQRNLNIINVIERIEGNRNFGHRIANQSLIDHASTK